MTVTSRINPFFEPSPLPFQAPPFDRIQDEDYQAALEEGMARELEEVRAIAANPDPPTFANTIEALERAGAILRRVSSVFHEIADSTSTPALRRIDAEEAPKLAAHEDAVYLNAALFARVKAVYEARESLAPGTEARRLVERRYRDFVRAGAGLAEADQTTLCALNEELARLTTEFRDRLLAATNDSAVIVEDPAALGGLSAQEVAGAAGRAAERGLPGRYLLSLQNTTQQAVMTRLEDRAVRKQVLDASTSRGRGGAHDTLAIAARIAQIRAQRARLLGFPNFAALELDDQVARTPERALSLLTGLVPASVAKARDEAGQLQALVRQSGGTFPVEAHDWNYFAEQVRRVDYSLDTNTVAPFFELDRVLCDGVFFAATALFGITFRERHDIPVYHPEVRVWDISEEDGSPLALFYGDFFARPSKSGGAWSHSFVGQNALASTQPVVVNVLNVVKPAPGDPVLLNFDEVETLFHEFGHTLHAIFSDTAYPTIGGTNVPRDWVEFPSQINEHWALHPVVFARYARHYQTGEAMPEALSEKLKRLRTFNQGYRTTEYLAAALLDHAWHTLPADAPIQDVEAFEAAALERFGVHLPMVPPRYSSPYFLHIWGRSYAATYYAYIWAEVLEQDAYRWIEAHGGLTRENGARLRKIVLSRGDTDDGDVMFRQLCGRDPDLQPLLEARGLQPQPR